MVVDVRSIFLELWKMLRREVGRSRLCVDSDCVVKELMQRNGGKGEEGDGEKAFDFFYW